MIVIDTTDALKDLLQRPIGSALRDFLVTRRDQLDHDVRASARFLVVEPPDTIADVEADIGFPLTIDDEPTWDIARSHSGELVELVINPSDDGPEDVVVVPMHDGAHTDLTILLRRHGALKVDSRRPTAA